MPGVDDNQLSDEPQDTAAEYVLGTLVDKDKEDFERNLQTSGDLRNEVYAWHSRLFSLHEGIEPVTPPKQVWKNIQSQLFAPSANAGFWQGLGLWKTLTATASIALIVLFLQFAELQKPQPLPETIALLSNNQAQAGWLVERLDVQGQLAIKPLTLKNPGIDKSYELWMLPSDGQAPKSLGLLSLSGKYHIQLDKAQVTVLDNSNALAVSLEPAGGSPTGLPTGPIVYTGKLLAI